MHAAKFPAAYQRMRLGDWETRAFLFKRYAGRLLSFVAHPMLLLVAVFLRVVLLTLKPIVHIRFGRMQSASLGVWAVPTELYLCEKDVGIQPTHSRDIFYHWHSLRYALKNPRKPKDQPCNKQLNIMFNRQLHVSQAASLLDGLNRMLPWGSEEFIANLASYADVKGVMDRIPTHFGFTEEEEQQGLAGLRDLGVEPGAPFVCFYARDGAYIFRDTPRWASIYGDWADSRYRNANIGNQLLAAEMLGQRGYFAIRLGKHVEAPLNSDDPRIIDYAYAFQSDFMDVYLSARCTFFVGQNSGMAGLPAIFRRPIAFINIMPFTEILYASPNDVVIPKNYYSKEMGRLFTFREILSERILSHYPGRRYASVEARQEYSDKVGLQIIENTPEEIAELAAEMDQRLNRAFQTSQEDEALQDRFQAILRCHSDAFPDGENYDFNRIRFGAHFLRTHQELLE